MVKHAVAGLGLAPDAALVTFPMDMFLPGSDLAPLRARRRELYDGLTSWQSRFARQCDGAPMLSVEAKSYPDALRKAHHLLLEKRLADGLPVWPPTPETVDWILRGSPLPRTHVIGKFAPRGGITTIETCAVALAMAGGRPEYLPVLIAAVEAFLAADTLSDIVQATSAGPFPVVIVNGSIGKQVRLNAGFGCLGPDPQHPAGAAIGRALRLLQQNVGGALPGKGTIATFGAMRYTNAVFAEDEDNLPQGWEPHATQRHDYARGTNSVSLVFATGVTNINRRAIRNETPAEDAVNGLWRMADYMRTPNIGALEGYEHGTPGIMMIAPAVAKSMAEVGWTKASIREFLWEHSKIPMAHLERAGVPGWIELDTNPVTRASAKLDPWPITVKPENIVLLVAGGYHPTHSHWLQSFSPRVTGRIVRVPECFEQLLAEAERDLGCASEARG